MASVALLVFDPIAHVQAVAGDLDAAFGNGGKVTTEFGETSPDGHHFPTSDSASDMALQPDGKIIVVGFSLGFFRSVAAVVRYNSDGSLDPSFGSGGKVLISGVGLRSVAIQTDGKVLVAGIKHPNFAVLRLNADGGIDPSFGTGGLAVINFELAPAASALVEAVGLDPAGKIVLVGHRSADSSLDFDFALARLNANGTPDSSFGSGGKVLTDFCPAQLNHGHSQDLAFGLAIQVDGKIIAAGTAAKVGSSARQFFGLARYNIDGSLDSSFGAGGMVVTDPAGPTGFQPGGQIRGIVLQADGRIVVAGEAAGSSVLQYNDIAVCRYNTDGSLDPSFGNAGLVKSDFSGNFNAGRAIALQQNGKIVVAGILSDAPGFPVGGMVVARYQTDGSLDLQFGVGGRVITAFGANNVGGAMVESIAIQGDGRIVVAGTSRSRFTGDDFALARYFGDAASVFDICIQDESNAKLLQLNSNTGEYQITNSSGFTLVGTGRVTRRGGVTTLEDNSARQRVVARIDGASRRATASITFFPEHIAFTITDRNTADSTCVCR